MIPLASPSPVTKHQTYNRYYPGRKQHPPAFVPMIDALRFSE